jgi:hypothetical protein
MDAAQVAAGEELDVQMLDPICGTRVSPGLI